MQTINLGIIDDHEVVINGLKAMLSVHQEINVILTAHNGEQLLQQLQTVQPDVLLMDIQMEGMDGIELTRHVHKLNPNIRIIAFSSFDETHYVRQIIRNGASGYLLKNAAQKTLLEAIKAVVEGEEYLDETIKKLMLNESITGQRRSIYEIPLTKREKEILKLIANEYSNQQIADALFISLRTVETHRLNLTQKLGVKNAAGLVKEAIKRGLIE
ncbi:response regulator transcription factor [Chitinophagaceae bacterium LB-8]|jgi:DNA-binding NarL/FixJ family response regulator|uniref:Response regulator transcription factor n=1 Tax=Paraflavisolibacter caeni TaxID=2982496 RepID=A0A9X2XWZ2_9BACT|nr:response regulator transcription factor [Paraflavisolibacter caeni]MCU7550067.1 response regulator transcription factor [Paraflavisolibacter caeni]